MINLMISFTEIRIYIIIFLLLQVILVFSVLRMYNAVVGNSRFLHAVKNAMQSFLTQIKNASNQFSQTGTEVENLGRELRLFGRNIIDLVKILKDINRKDKDEG